MGQSSNGAESKGAQINLRKEECASGMGQCTNGAAAKDAQIRLRMEDYALGMGQRLSYAAEKDAQIRLRDGACARGVGHIAIHTMNLLHSDQNSIRELQLNPNPISMLQDLRS